MIELVRALLAWVESHPKLTTALTVGSLVLFVASLLLGPWLLVRLPADFFARDVRAPASERSLGRFAWSIMRNSAAACLFALGVLMIVLPGQGLLTLLAALFVADFRRKRELERWFVSRPGVRTALDALRRKAGKPPFDLPRHLQH